MNRTYQNIESNLARGQNPVSTVNNSYLTCRYDPFNNTNITSSRPPDGTGKHTVIRDYKATYDLDMTGNTQLHLFPATPILAQISSQSNYSVNSLVAVGDLVNRGYPISLSTVQLLEDFIVNQTAPTPAANFVNARCISYGYKLSYTGKASDANGLLVADTYSIAVETSPNSFDHAGNITYVNDVGALASYPFIGTNASFVQLDAPTAGFRTSPNYLCPTVQPNNSKTAITLRPEAGMKGTLKRSVLAEAHSFKPVYNNCVWSVVAGSNTTGDIESSFNVIMADNAYKVGVPQIRFIDDDFDSTVINIVTSSQRLQMRLEILLCLELECRTNSTHYLYSMPDPPRNPMVLAMDDALNSIIPAGTSLNTSMTPMLNALTAGSSTKSRRIKRKRGIKRKRNVTITRSTIRRPKRNTAKRLITTTTVKRK